MSGAEYEKAHADDLSPCDSVTIRNEGGVLWCNAHDRPVYGSGWLVSPDAVCHPEPGSGP